MLKRLYISNFALINEMDVTFPGKLTVITGETGAGKSIFLEALGLALGRRAETGTLRNKEKKCVVEAEFDISSLGLEDFFSENEIDYSPQIIARREIGPEGRSRSFINDSVVPSGVLKQLSERLVDIHSQHQTMLLNQSNFQLDLVDAFAGNESRLAEYSKVYRQLTSSAKKLEGLLGSEAQARKDLDYYRFLFTELESANLGAGNMIAWEEESATLENAETIRGALLNVSDRLYSGEQNILGQLAPLRQSLQGIARYSPVYSGFSDRLNSACIELKELAADLENTGGDIHSDPERLNELIGKQDAINRLFKKHSVTTEEELLTIKDDIGQKLGQFGSLEQDISATQAEIKKLKDTCRQKAAELSEHRKKVVPEIEKKVKHMLTELSLVNAVFRIQITESEEPGPSGADVVRFLFSANKGGIPAELNKVASGGELSRLMLTLKALLAEKKKLPSIVFDEIDTGVSGEVAHKIGSILLKMGASMQVIAITHLPQMASKGDHHLFVYKKDSASETVSRIRELSREERVSEIAKMLSTSKPTDTAYRNAKELLDA